MENSLAELRGLVMGIAADGRIVESEAKFLLQWLEGNEALVQSEPAIKALYKRAADVLKDGKLNSSEGKSLLEIMHRLILPKELQFSEEKIPTPYVNYSDPYKKLDALELIPSKTGIFDKVQDITFMESTFCFTGVFAFGDRKACQVATANLGAEIKNNILKNNLFLVVGSLASPDWKHGNYGSKIEKALKYKKEGGSIKIIHEDTWANFLCEAEKL